MNLPTVLVGLLVSASCLLVPPVYAQPPPFELPAAGRGGDAQERLLLIQALVRETQVPRAEAQYREFVRRYPARVADRLLLARALYWDTHRFQLAIRELAAIASQNPDSALAQLQLGDVDIFQDDATGALRHFRRALELDPGNLHARWGIADAALMQGNYDSAMRQVRPLIEAYGRQDGLSPDDHRQLSMCYLTYGAAEGLEAQHGGLFAVLQYGLDVRSTLEKALQADPTNSWAYYAMGRYFLIAPAMVGGDPQRAIGEFLRAQKVDPANYHATLSLIEALEQQHHEASARTELAWYRKTFQDLPGALAALAELNPD